MFRVMIHRVGVRPGEAVPPRASGIQLAPWAARYVDTFRPGGQPLDLTPGIQQRAAFFADGTVWRDAERGPTLQAAGRHDDGGEPGGRHLRLVPRDASGTRGTACTIAESIDLSQYQRTISAFVARYRALQPRNTLPEELADQLHADPATGGINRLHLRLLTPLLQARPLPVAPHARAQQFAIMMEQVLAAIVIDYGLEQAARNIRNPFFRDIAMKTLFYIGPGYAIAMQLDPEDLWSAVTMVPRHAAVLLFEFGQVDPHCDLMSRAMTTRESTDREFLSYVITLALAHLDDPLLVQCALESLVVSEMLDDAQIAQISMWAARLDPLTSVEPLLTSRGALHHPVPEAWQHEARAALVGVQGRLKSLAIAKRGR